MTRYEASGLPEDRKGEFARHLAYEEWKKRHSENRNLKDRFLLRGSHRATLQLGVQPT
jgi:hypothetical protein